MKKQNLIMLALPGIIIAFALSLLGRQLSQGFPLLDAFFVAFIAAIMVGIFFKNKSMLWMGTAFCKDLLLPIGLLLYGTQMNQLEISRLDPPIVLFSVLNMFLYFGIIFICNRFLFRIRNNKISYLNGGANAICGISATAVFVPFVDAKEDEISMTLLAVVVTGMISVFATWFIIQPAVQFSSPEYATFCGLTLNQTGAVKEAAGFMGKDAVALASTIKFFRTCLLIPVAFALMFLTRYAGGTAKKLSMLAMEKAMIYGIMIALLFFGASLLFSFTPLQAYAKPIRPWFTIIFGMFLVSVGLLCDVKKFFKKEFLLNMASSSIAWVFVAIVNILLIKSLR
jgi:uncharacterized integral membrane protein (TIGR00698 family)